jgi:hypothetical protein
MNPATGQYGAYWVLSEEERAKGFVRPVRTTYVHVGLRPRYVLRDLTCEEHERYDEYGYVKYEEYPEDEDSAACGRFWTEADLNSGCGSTTVMSQQLAETYARDPKFYGATFCYNCGKHLPVQEFMWNCTDEVVGS